MGKMKDIYTDIQQIIHDCLNDKSMTNDQAIKEVEAEYGSMGKYVAELHFEMERANNGNRT